METEPPDISRTSASYITNTERTRTPAADEKKQYPRLRAGEGCLLVVHIAEECVRAHLRKVQGGQKTTTKHSLDKTPGDFHLLRISTVSVTHRHLVRLQEVAVRSRRNKVEGELAVSVPFQHVRRHEVYPPLPHLGRAARVVAVGAAVEIRVIPALQVQRDRVVTVG